MKKLLARLQQDYPSTTFEISDSFRWNGQTQTIYFDQAHEQAEMLLLHELAHACLDHAEFQFDIELIKKESEAWDYAALVLAPRYGLSIGEEAKQDAMDSYRDWLHARSLCPNCHVNSLQTKTGTYKCVTCGCQWRANQARTCELRRYKLSEATV